MKKVESKGSWLGGIFWQNWENNFEGNPIKALESAGYPAGPDHGLVKKLNDLLIWIEESSNLKEKHPSLTTLYNYEADGLTMIEFLVLTKLFAAGNRESFDKVFEENIEC